MSQEFTPEQVGEMVGRIWDHTTDGHPAHLANLQTASAMLDAYAATLRQQAARVDGAMVERAFAAWDAAYAANSRDAIRAALEAALSAQPAPERQGEAVAKVRHFDYRGVARNGFSQEAEMLDGAPIVPDGTLLYTHTAAPVGVPEIRVTDTGAPRGEPNLYRVQLNRLCVFEAMGSRKALATCIGLAGKLREALAAAPSAPQGTQQGEG